MNHRPPTLLFAPVLPPFLSFPFFRSQPIVPSPSISFSFTHGHLQMSTQSHDNAYASESMGTEPLVERMWSKPFVD